MAISKVCVGALCLLLAGCSNLPAPQSQIRLSKGVGIAEASMPLTASGGVQGDACILSIVGKPPKLNFRMKLGSCEVSTGEWYDTE